MAENDVVTRAREVLAGITPGEWTLDALVHTAIPDGSWRTVVTTDDTLIAPCATDTDAAFIAASPDLVRGLLAEVERLRALADYWERQFVRAAAVAKRCPPANELYAQCEYCHAIGETPETIQHTTDCLVTEKRSMAKKVYHDAE